MAVFVDPDAPGSHDEFTKNSFDPWFKLSPTVPMAERIARRGDRQRRAMQLVLRHTVQSHDQSFRGQLTAFRRSSRMSWPCG